MFCNHSKIIIPSLVIPYNLALQVLECESRNVVSQLMLRKDLRWYLLCVLLVLNIPDYHALEYRISLSRMRVRLCQLSICKSVITIIKLCDVSAEVLHDSEFSSRVYSFITSSAKH